MRQGKRIVALVALAAGIGLVGVGPAVAAPGDTVYTGATAEGVKVKLTAATAGNATKFKVGKTKVHCDEGGTLSNDAGTYTGFDTSDPGSFSDKRSTASDSGGYHFKTKSTLAGTAAEDGATWTGKLKLSTKVYKRNALIDTCKLKTTWDAS